MHIGLIGGIGPAATVIYYNGLVEAARAAGHELKLTIVQAELATLAANMRAGDPDAQAAIYAGHIRALAAAGAEVAAITSLGGHFCFDQARALSGLPLCSGLDVIRDFARAQAPGRVGVLGTAGVMQSGVFGALDGFDPVVPGDEMLAQVGKTYMDIALSGQCTTAQRELLFHAGDALIKQGASVVLLGGTDLGLAFDGHDPGYSVADGALLHVAELARLAVQ